MYATPEQFAAANKAAVESLLSVANTALASAERIASLPPVLPDGELTPEEMNSIQIGEGETLEQIKARQNQAYYLQYDKLDDAIAAMSQQERADVLADVLADTTLAGRLSETEIAKLKSPAAPVSPRPSSTTDYA